MKELRSRLEARGIEAGVWDYYDDGKGDRSLELGVTLSASTSEEALERVTEALTTETPPRWPVDWSVRLGVSTRSREFIERLNRLRQKLPPALTFLDSGGGPFHLHDAHLLALVVDDAGQEVVRLRLDPPWDVSVELTISYAHARLIGITEDEREELNADGASIYGNELESSADGRFVHRFEIEASYFKDSDGERVMLGRSLLGDRYFPFAIEFDDAAMSLHLPDHVLDLGQPDARAALQATVALLRQHAGDPVGAGFAWWLNDLSQYLAAKLA